MSDPRNTDFPAPVGPRTRQLASSFMCRLRFDIPLSKLFTVIKDGALSPKNFVFGEYFSPLKLVFNGRKSANTSLDIRARLTFSVQ